MDRVAVFGVVLFAIQIVEGTAVYFSVGTLAFVLIAALAFNTAGGLTRPSGAYVFFYAMLDFLVGVCYKTVLWEPGESNLLDPHTTIAVYVGGISGLLLAVVVSRRFSRKVGLLQNVLKEDQMYRATMGCIVFSVAAPFLISMLGNAAARVNSAFNQLNELAELAILIGVMYEVRRSGGTRTLNTPTVFALVWTFFIYGLLGFSKQGLLTPFYCWLLPLCALRYRFSNLQIAGGIVWILVVFEILVPYSQYGRRFVTDNPGMATRMNVAVRLLSDPVDLRKKYKEGVEEIPSTTHYFNEPQGFWDRLTFVAPDDALINVTDQGRTFGYLPVITSLINVVPRVFMPNKVAYSFGNIYAHEIGGLSEEDTTTGISFSPSAEAYHMGRWVGLLVVAPLVWVFAFIILDSLVGDTRLTPWGLLAVAVLSHGAPETGMEGAIYIATYGAEILTFSALFATWVAPLVSIAVLGQARRTVPIMPRPGGGLGRQLATEGGGSLE